MSKGIQISFDHLTKETFEKISGIDSISDSIWDKIISEIHGRADVWIDQLIPDLAQDIEEGHYDD
jgi:hypothetical protein